MPQRQEIPSTPWISHRLRRFAILTALFLSVQGCTTSKDGMQKTSVRTMKMMYDEKFQKEQGLTRDDVQRLDKVQLAETPALSSAVAPLKATFRYLPNPTLVMYVTPHLTDAGTPIPGYATYFKLYEQDHVALPHEPFVEGD